MVGYFIDGSISFAAGAIISGLYLGRARAKAEEELQQFKAAALIAADRAVNKL